MSTYSVRLEDNRLLNHATVIDGRQGDKVTDPETRKAIAQRVINNASARGAPIDGNPDFIQLLDEWVRGDIDFEVMREHHANLLKRQAAERRDRRIMRSDTIADKAINVSPPDDTDEKKGHENRGP